MLHLPFLLLISPSFAHTASLYFPSIPEDLYAFPKHRVSFVNGLYLSNDTAHRWLADGLAGGEDEFLGREWQSKSITGQEDASDTALQGLIRNKRPATLQLMRLGPNTSYLCLIPPPPLATSFSSQGEKALVSRSPAKSWELLQPMSQGCLYHVLGWFTYAYCHGKYVKQFREAPHAHPHPPGGRIPEEDPEWESYFLGIAPNQDSTELMTAEDIAAANKLELARGAGQRYLVQRWEDGTVCDKTGIPRKIEVQFHCSMTTPDKILLIKETSTCNYVLVIHTPRLCGEPGFKSERDTQEESVIRCREILNEKNQEKHSRLAAAASAAESAETKTEAVDNANSASTPQSTNAGLNEGHHPIRFPLVQQRKQLPKVPVADSAADDGSTAASGETAKKSGKRDHTDLLRRALLALLQRTEEENGATPDQDRDNAANGDASTNTPFGGRKNVVAVDGEDGEKIFLFIDNIDELENLDLTGGGGGGGGADAARVQLDDAARLSGIGKKLLETLKSTGLKAARRSGEAESATSSSSTESTEGEKKKDGPNDGGGEGDARTHDEL